MVAASINGYLYQAVTVPLMKITTPAKKIRKGTDVASEPLLTASRSWSQPSTSMTKRPHLQDDGRAVQVPGAVSEAGIEEAGVVRAQLADGGFVGDHLRCIVRRHADALLRHENVKIFRFQQ